MYKVLGLVLVSLTFTGCSSGFSNFIGDLSKTEAMNICQQEVNRKLKEPRSMKVIPTRMKYIKPQNSSTARVSFEFYANNSEGGEDELIGICEFNKYGDITSSWYDISPT